MSYHDWITVSVLSLTVLAGGCRRVYTFVPVEGTITQGNKPLVGVQIIFLADPDAGTEGPRSLGTTDAAGHYRLQTDRGDDGAVVGQHRICIFVPRSREENDSELPPYKKKLSPSKPEDPTTPKGAGPDTPIVPASYSSLNKTPLRAEVRPGGIQTINFNIP